MADLVSFRVTRVAQRNVTEQDRIIPAVRSSTLVQQLLMEAAGGGEPESVLADLRGVAQGFIGSDKYIDLAARRGEDDDPLGLLIHLDRWLTERRNEPPVAELETELQPIVQAASRQSGDPGLNDNWLEIRRRLGESLVAATVAPLLVRVRSRLIRYIVLAELVATRSAGRPIDSPAGLDRLLTGRTVTLPVPLFPLEDLLGLPRRSLVVREPAFADLFVVRNEWSCYLPGEISHVENVLLGETKVRSLRRIDESETTTTTESERLVVEERESQSTDRFELADELEQSSELTIGLDGQVDTSGRYGPTQVDTHIGATLDYSLSEAKKRIAKQAHELVGRASTRVEQRVRTARTARSLTRTESFDEHTLDNAEGTGNVRGIYRWVDKVQRMQIFRYSNRYLLEFHLPEPGARVRYRMAQPAPDILEPPPAPPPSASTIAADTYQQLLATYRAARRPATSRAAARGVRHAVVGAEGRAAAGRHQGPLQRPDGQRVGHPCRPPGLRRGGGVRGRRRHTDPRRLGSRVFDQRRL